MIFFSETRFDFCGDEYIYAEISRDMKIESTLKVLSITGELRKRNIPGMIEIYPNNTSYLIRYDPLVISPHHLLDYLREVDRMKNDWESLNVEGRLVEIPVLYDDEKTREISKQYAQLNERSEQADFDYAMEMSGMSCKETFIQRHADPLYFVTALGFKPGTAWTFPLLGKEEQTIQAPKYNSPRPFTPERAVGIGGAFTVVYPSNSTGSYQLIGMSAVPVYDVQQRLVPFKDSFFLARPGDLWKYRPVTIAEYDHIRQQVKEGKYKYNIQPVTFSAAKYDQQGEAYLAQLKEEFSR